MHSLSLMLALGVQCTSVDSSGFGGGSGTPPVPPLGMAMLARPKAAHIGVLGGRLMFNGHLFYDHAAIEGAYRHSRTPAAHPKLSYTYTAYAPTLAPPPPAFTAPPPFL